MDSGAGYYSNCSFLTTVMETHRSWHYNKKKKLDPDNNGRECIIKNKIYLDNIPEASGTLCLP